MRQYKTDTVTTKMRAREMEIYRDLEDCMIDRQSKGERVKDRYRNYENKSKTERESMRYTET